ncbi:MAG: valine--tRNA ligase [Frankiaceae bacterium]
MTDAHLADPPALRGRDLPSTYSPADVEGRLYEQWVARGYFRADASSGRPPFSIVIPPPNVTGSLHMGHALDHALMDALTRRRRMQGYEALWLPGMDHAGIATQNVVERELAKEGKSRHDLGRAAFVSRVWEWRREYGGRILDQMRRLGDGVDWSRERFTMDEGLSRAVLTIFKRLHDDGLIYRAERIINWCPRCLTALSDIEVEHHDDEGELVSISYGPITVATTRVETMLGDTAVAVHPDDERYRHLVGTELELPLVGRKIRVIADGHVDPAFGSGAVKVTPAHDPNDFDIGQRHDLESVTVLDERGVITLPGPWQGLDRFEARDTIKQMLREEGRVVAERRPYVHAVGHCSRCDTVVEPRLSLQWFVKVAPLAAAAGDAVRAGRTRIEPPELAQRYFDWVDNMHDWCISRQLWWGHRIPVWYGPDGQVRVLGPDDEPPSAEAGWQQDEDVLDTWFSSALWPFSTLGWPEGTADLARFYPTSVLVTGYDILFFWVARMMMFGIYAMSDRRDPPAVPFDVVALHGLVRDRHGKKMSKSRGNVVDPLDLVSDYGADALRFTLAKGANPGADLAISEEWVQGSRNFVTKLWNAGRFALMRGATVEGPLPATERMAGADRWILSRLSAVIVEVDALYESFEFGKVADTLFHFAWDEVFDWYVELAKAPIDGGGEPAAVTRRVLGHVLDALLRLLHPVMPFVTEELWTSLTGGESVVIASWPVADESHRDPAAEAELALLRGLVTEVRRFRAEQGVKPRQRLAATLRFDDPGAEVAVPGQLAQLEALAGLAPVEVGEPPPGRRVVVAPGVRVGIDLADAIDPGAERARLAKLVSAAEREREQAAAKLANPAFVDNAPPHVVGKIRDRLAAAEAELAPLRAQLDALPS